MTPMTPARLASALAVRLQVERDAAVARTKQMEADLVEANGVIQRVMRDREMWQARAEANVEVVELTPRRKELADAQTALAAMTTERDVLRELLNVYNVGGWTDAVAPMQRALKAETERDEADTALAACQSQAAAKIDQLERDCHALKRAIGPVSAGPEPWEGMPPTSFYVAVADRRREMSLKVRPADAVSRLHNLADSFETCDDCEQSACDDAKTDGPHVLCHDCISKYRALQATLTEARRVLGECQDMLMNPEWLDACIDVDGLLAKITALIARIEQCLPAIDAGLQCPTCGSREHLDEADICDRCDRAAVDVVRRRMTVEQFIAHVGRVDALIGGR